MADDLEKIHHVAWLDFLGFEEYLEAHSLTEVVGFLRDDLPDAIDKMTSELAYRDGGFDLAGERCEVEQFQDTMVLWTWDSDFDALKTLVQTVERVVAVLHMNGFPCRGAISQGTLYTARLDAGLGDQRPAIVVGDGVLAASRLERQCEWAGVVIDEGDALPNSDEWKDLLFDLQEKSGSSGRVHRYGGLPNSDNVLFVGWPHTLKDKRPEEILDAMWPSGSPPENLGRKKYEQTEKFLKWWMDSDRFGLSLDELEAMEGQLENQLSEE